MNIKGNFHEVSETNMLLADGENFNPDYKEFG